MMGTTPPDIEQRVLDTARQRLHDLAAAVQQRFGVTAGTHVVAGALLAELARKVDDLTASLLVCGAKGESVIRRYALGTMAVRVLSTTTCPVLVVKQSPHESYRRLLVPVDFSRSSLRAIGLARSTAPKADIVLLHVFDVPFEGQLRYASVGDDTINQLSGHRQTGRPCKSSMPCALQAGLNLTSAWWWCMAIRPRIIEQEQEWDCDLIVMGKHGENLLEELLIGSVTKHVLAESQGDVLVSV
jgi:universal stress protein E